MHLSSYERMKEFVEKYLDINMKLRILDVGSCDVSSGNVSGTYKNLFNNANWEYIGADIQKGRNVDLVLKKPYDWGIPNKSFDVIISGQTLEHVEDTKEWIKQVEKTLKVNGLVCIIAPWLCPQHWTIDCWRILPDGMKFLLKKVCGFEIIKVFKMGHDCIGIAKKVIEK